MKRTKAKKIEGATFTFRQYMCSNCRKMFFIERKKDLPNAEAFEEFNRTYQSPCCRPYSHTLMKKLIEPRGIYIRELKLKVVEITDEIALVAKRRGATESGKPDPYQDKNEEDDDEEESETA